MKRVLFIGDINVDVMMGGLQSLACCRSGNYVRIVHHHGGERGGGLRVRAMRRWGATRDFLGWLVKMSMAITWLIPCGMILRSTLGWFAEPIA